MSGEPEAWSWEEYEAFLLHEWPQVLDRDAASERAVHEFLEVHPCLLPGGEASVSSIGGHHGPLPGAVITQPALPGTWKRVPDFLWPTKRSGAFFPVLLEIERPNKQWFRDDGQQTAELTQAVNQVAEWRTWLDSEANQQVFYQRYGVSDWIRAYHKVQPVFSLVYGRRAEFIEDPIRTRHRESLRPDWLKWATFDRLRPDAGARNWVTVKIEAGRWTVISIPPTFTIKMGWQDDLQGLQGLDVAIEKNELISESRKEFLLAEVAQLDLKPAAPANLWEATTRAGDVGYS